ncbi:efflux RND transporter periplasmic adaptor subunit [Fodinibius halophilus]|uniref:Efflux RND transporter periplasmic adaptor subunit n=1 Tax=Fodinibius halophilus TaxID=1736908 RepID=A0A6M1TH41_9BACT|nr:efflux RND transporter periplasmic adaptor subunit [Fodinibius halophilus]NGP87970.1 efflux RND transporter periplasmic adaptor subunit [Fodinibius halophilus]
MKNLTVLTLAGLLLGSLLKGCGAESGSQTHTQNEQHQQESQHSEEPEQHTEEDGQHAREVHLTEQQEGDLGIKVETLSEGSASSTISRPASIGYDLDQIAKVGPRIEAKVVKVIKGLGERVKKEEPIALMSSVGLGKAKAEYIRLRTELKAEKAHYEREKSLYEQEISSRAEMLQAEAHYQEAKAAYNAAAESLRLYGLSKKDLQNIEAGSDKPLSHFYLTSPLDGVIQERDISPGQTISSSETPIHVANLSKMWVMIDAYEQDIRYLGKGQSVSLTVRSIPGETFEGKTDWVSYSLEKGTRTMPVRAVVENPNRKLRAGMYGTARISTEKERNVAMIPIDAVQTIEGEQVVFVPGNEEGSYKPVEVILGNENEGYAEIATGLKPGRKAVVAGAFDLKSALTAQGRSASHGH